MQVPISELVVHNAVPAVPETMVAPEEDPGERDCMLVAVLSAPLERTRTRCDQSQPQIYTISARDMCCASVCATRIHAAILINGGVQLKHAYTSLPVNTLPKWQNKTHAYHELYWIVV